MTYCANVLPTNHSNEMNNPMHKLQFEQLRTRILELPPQQLLTLRTEIEGKLHEEPAEIILTDEELQIISGLFRE
ncbi:hypothetical protein QWZ04_00090 [Vibrio tapetis subsp. quintayensis]|uniref:hypothetical protein n=1 Tax=Vibrio tapetis TaxID=52443 RepID=UPI0025B38E14|nr:hypothetical protein [Vibrio tapetis]MDN3678746.1 hypothetical protein [Vibrio tapetis subsp. quintayensis]